MLSYVTYSFVFYCALLCFYHHILRIGVLIYSAPQMQECLINLLTYLLTYLSRILRKKCQCLARISRDKFTVTYLHTKSVTDVFIKQKLQEQRTRLTEINAWQNFHVFTRIQSSSCHQISSTNHQFSSSLTIYQSKVINKDCKTICNTALNQTAFLLKTDHLQICVLSYVCMTLTLTHDLEFNLDLDGQVTICVPKMKYVDQGIRKLQPKQDIQTRVNCSCDLDLDLMT